MTILERARPCAFSALLMCQAGSPVQAAVLAVFDFDAAGGGFTTTPGLLHPDVATASFTTTLTPLADFAGNPGRALASSGFTLGNRIVLELAARPGQQLLAESLAFDARVSASGPQTWSIALAGAAAQSGPLTTAFAPVTLTFDGAAAAPQIVIEFAGAGASSASGTWRLDNLRVEGQVIANPVPLPAGLPLLGSATLAAAVLRRRRRSPIPASRRPAGSRAPA
ncbi:MAG: hypothetical protein H6977_06535 [Gammaproteobacteria bacterium]|nr:hypothetical protein [Gammaproteobacteria bacterium]MCP5199649.1 hypothetical protein [Gammaproteobacteria bacterium]